MTREELEALKKIVEQEEARLKEEGKKPKPKVWKPKDEEKVYNLLSDGVIFYSTYCELSDYAPSEDSCLDGVYLQGNLFRTKEEAEFERERRNVIKELQDFATEHNEPIDWNDSSQGKWFIYYDYWYKGLYVLEWNSNKYSDIYFSSQQIAKQAIEQIGEDRIKKYYLRVEE